VAIWCASAASAYNTALLPELFDYCAQDVRAMRAISKGMRGLSDDELLDYMSTSASTTVAC